MAALLKKGGGKGTGRPAAIIANLSARVGSIGDNGTGGWYAYRASKTALNQCKCGIYKTSRTLNPIPVYGRTLVKTFQSFVTR
jgi:hypothetical protein